MPSKPMRRPATAPSVSATNRFRFSWNIAPPVVSGRPTRVNRRRRAKAGELRRLGGGRGAAKDGARGGGAEIEGLVLLGEAPPHSGGRRQRARLRGPQTSGAEIDGEADGPADDL